MPIFFHNNLFFIVKSGIIKRMVKSMRKHLIFILFILLFLSGCQLTGGNQQGNGQINLTLDAPELIFEDNVVYWEKVDGALIYLFYVNDTLITETSKCSYDISKFGYGEFEIKVIASGYEGEKSSPGILELTIEEEGRPNVGVFMINDTHGAVLDDETPGIARVGTILDQYSSLYGDLVAVANGDIFQGSYASNILRGRPLIDAFNALDFDCFVIGNHEFDWGLDKIAVYKDGNLENGEADFPFLGANIYDRSTNEMVDWLEPYTIVEKNGLKVGIIGIIGYNLESSINSTFITDYEFVYPLEIIKEHARTLRTEEDCDLVIVSNHDYDESLNYNISRLEGDYAIDLILCGHTHQNCNDELLRPDGKKIIAVQNRDKNQTASFVNLHVDENKDYLNYEFERIYPGDYSNDPSIVDELKQYDSIFAEGNKVLGTSPSYLNKSTLGYYATAAMTEEFGCDISIINTAGVRGTIDSGVITVSDVFNAFPFDNEVFIISLSGSDVKNLYYENSNFLYFNKEFNISSIKNSSYYSIAVIDYVFNSPYYDQFKNVDYIDDDVILRDLLIEYIDNKY